MKHLLRIDDDRLGQRRTVELARAAPRTASRFDLNLTAIAADNSVGAEGAFVDTNSALFALAAGTNIMIHASQPHPDLFRVGYHLQRSAGTGF